MKIKKKEIESEIFTGSMADISFLLIIYFMITSAFSATRGLDFALPDENQDTPEIKQEDSIDVYVMPGGQIQVDGNPIALFNRRGHGAAGDQIVVCQTGPGCQKTNYQHRPKHVFAQSGWFFRQRSRH